MHLRVLIDLILCGEHGVYDLRRRSGTRLRLFLLIVNVLGLVLACTTT